MPVQTRRTPPAAAVDTVAGSDTDMADASGSLSVGTGSATLGYKPKPLTVIVLLYVVAAVMISMFSYAINISSTYEAVACIILVLVFCLSYLRINVWCKMTKYPTARTRGGNISPSQLQGRHWVYR